jgi:hypothetical protein
VKISDRMRGVNKDGIDAIESITLIVNGNVCNEQIKVKLMAKI